MQFSRFRIAGHTHILAYSKHIVAACHYVIYFRGVVAQIGDKPVVRFRFGGILFSCPSAVGHFCNSKPVSVVTKQSHFFTFAGAFLRCRDIPYLIPSAYSFVTSLDNKETFTGLRLIVIMRGAVGCHIRPFGVITYIGGKSGCRCLFRADQAFRGCAVKSYLLYFEIRSGGTDFRAGHRPGKRNRGILHFQGSK